MKKESSGSPAIIFISFAIMALIAIAFGFYFGGEDSYAIACFCVAALFFLMGIVELIDFVVINPLIHTLTAIFPDSEDMDL